MIRDWLANNPGKTANQPILCFWLILIFSASIVGCDSKAVNERKSLEYFNNKPGHHAHRNKDASLYVSFPKHANLAVTKPDLLIPPTYEPLLSTDFNHQKIYFKFTLPHLTNFDSPAPIPSDIAEEVRTYSMYKVLLGGRPDSIDTPRVKESVQRYMQHSRLHKYVRIEFENRVFEKYDDFKAYLMSYHDIEPIHSREDSRGEVTRDGIVSGLERYSKINCFDRAEIEQNYIEPGWERRFRNLEYLKSKAADDRSPADCILDRINAFHISPPTEKESEWTFIECRTPHFTCTATFFVAHQSVEVDLYYVDLPNWRDSIEPIRAAINSFIVAKTRSEGAGSSLAL